MAEARRGNRFPGTYVRRRCFRRLLRAACAAKQSLKDVVRYPRPVLSPFEATVCGLLWFTQFKLQRTEVISLSPGRLPLC